MAFFPTAASGLQQLDTTHSPVALWQFDGDIDYSSGNSYDLSVAACNARFVGVTPRFKGVSLDGATGFTRASTAELNITGDITIECGIRLGYWAHGSHPDNYAMIYEYPGGGASQAQNITSALYLAHSNAEDRYMAWYTESGSGSGAAFSDGATNLVMGGSWYHLCVTRASNVVTFYINGNAMAQSSALTTPDGGTSSQPHAFISESATQTFTGEAFSLKIIDGALSASDVAAEARRMFPWL